MPSQAFDLLIRNAVIATASDTYAADIGFREGRIVVLEPTAAVSRFQCQKWCAYSM